MKLRDHEKIVNKMNELHAAQLRAERRRSAALLLQYLTAATLRQIAEDLERNQDAGAAVLMQVVETAQNGRLASCVAGHPLPDA